MAERSFLKAVKRGLIAEIKFASPSKGVIYKGKLKVEDIAKIYEENGAVAISVLTDEKFFHGSFENLRRAKKATTRVPILCKDFIVYEYQIYKAREYGADAVLLIVKLLSVDKLKKFLKIAGELKMDCLVEVHDEQDLKKALKAGAKIIGINTRDLKTFRIDIEVVGKLVKKIPRGKVIVAESGIETRKAMKRVNAILVGTAIMSSKNIAAKVKELCF
ncbi:MAG: indole-3-glycerol-phosphate synthase [Candidatus Gracilibacteria bacterium]